MYVTLEEYKQYALEKRMITLNPDSSELKDNELTKQLFDASIFLDSKEEYLIGSRTERDQDYAYPRKDLIINGKTYTDDEIPLIVKRVQMELALEINSGVDLFTSAEKESLPVISKRIEGAITTEYAAPSSVKSKKRQSAAINMLNQLMKRINFFSIPVYRA